MVLLGMPIYLVCRVVLETWALFHRGSSRSMDMIVIIVSLFCCSSSRDNVMKLLLPSCIDSAPFSIVLRNDAILPDSVL